MPDTALGCVSILSYCNYGKVIINGVVTAEAEGNGAGIGGGGCGAGGVEISVGTVSAKSGDGGSGIGGGAGVETEDSDNAVFVTGGRVSVQSGDWDIVITTDGVEIAGYSGNDTMVEIPSEICGKPVTSINADAFSGSSIVSVIIPDSVTTIGDGTFSG